MAEEYEHELRLTFRGEIRREEFRLKQKLARRDLVNFLARNYPQDRLVACLVSAGQESGKTEG